MEIILTSNASDREYERQPVITFKLLNEKIVGKVVEDNLFLERNSKKHFYKKRRGYPANNEMLKICKKIGIKNIIVIEHRSDGSTRERQCSLQKYLNAVLIHEKGYEPQRCVPFIELEEKDKYENLSSWDKTIKILNTGTPEEVDKVLNP